MQITPSTYRTSVGNRKKQPDSTFTIRTPLVMKWTIFLCLLISLGIGSARAGKTAFSQDSAYANLNFLVNVIGPRPMGSPAEARALRFAAAKFREYGCQEAYVMPMANAAGVNTSSGIAVGVLKGKTERIILIGGHIDSEGPEVPGANDDGSGAVSVIELARVIGSKEHESTVVFCCWGGEEEGLRGSEYFVAHYKDIDSVALMLQIDMADGAGNLDADPDGAYQVSAPHWLVDAAFDVFYDDLHAEGLVYPSQAATVNSSSGGGTGSDHMPFLAKGIPAIDFTSDITYPIHTPLDSWANFNPSGLPRSGDLVLRLFENHGQILAHRRGTYAVLFLPPVPARTCGAVVPPGRRRSRYSPEAPYPRARRAPHQVVGSEASVVHAHHTVVHVALRKRDRPSARLPVSLGE